MSVSLKATDFVDSSDNVKVGDDGLVYIGNGGFVEYDVQFDYACKAGLESIYASDGPRPVFLVLNSFDEGEICKQSTKGRGLSNVGTFKDGFFNLAKGTNTMRIESDGVCPHLLSFVWYDTGEPPIVYDEKTAVEEKKAADETGNNKGSSKKGSKAGKPAKSATEAGADSGGADTGADTAGTIGTTDTADTADTGADTADTADTTADTGADTAGDTGADTGDTTADTGYTTAGTADTTGADTADTGDTTGTTDGPLEGSVVMLPKAESHDSDQEVEPVVGVVTAPDAMSTDFDDADATTVDGSGDEDVTTDVGGATTDATTMDGATTDIDGGSDAGDSPRSASSDKGEKSTTKGSSKASKDSPKKDGLLGRLTKSTKKSEEEIVVEDVHVEPVQWADHWNPPFDPQPDTRDRPRKKTTKQAPSARTKKTHGSISGLLDATRPTQEPSPTARGHRQDHREARRCDGSRNVIRHARGKRLISRTRIRSAPAITKVYDSKRKEVKTSIHEREKKKRKRRDAKEKFYMTEAEVAAKAAQELRKRHDAERLAVRRKQWAQEIK